MTVAGRFWSKVAIGERNECWPWLAGKFDSGYGAFSLRPGKLVRAHRFAFTLYWGAPVHNALHECDNKPCCNPWHLWDGTTMENVADRDAKGRQARGETSGTAKLTAAQVLIIRADPREQREIARDYGVCKSTIGYIKRLENWRHL